MRSKITGKRILIVGGAGFIGSHLADYLLSHQPGKIIIMDNMFLGNMNNIKGALQNGVVFYRDDAELHTSIEYIIQKHQVEVVFNCATKALNYSFLNPANAFSTNTNVIINLLELQRKECFETLCHLSSSEAYGSAVYEPMDENHPLHPTTTYAAGKAAADIALETYVKMFDVDSFIVRPFNNYGPRQNYTGYLAGVIPTTIRKIIEGGMPEIHGSGRQSREFIYVTDTVNAIITLFSLLKPGESINIAAESQITIEKLVSMICELMDYRGKVIIKEPRKSDVQCHNASLEKIRGLIDYKLTPLDIGLKETVEWYINNIKS